VPRNARSPWDAACDPSSPGGFQLVAALCDEPVAKTAPGLLSSLTSTEQLRGGTSTSSKGLKGGFVDHCRRCPTWSPRCSGALKRSCASPVLWSLCRDWLASRKRRCC
jgi:hypothetical protein